MPKGPRYARVANVATDADENVTDPVQNTVLGRFFDGELSPGRCCCSVIGGISVGLFLAFFIFSGKRGADSVVSRPIVDSDRQSRITAAPSYLATDAPVLPPTDQPSLPADTDMPTTQPTPQTTSPTFEPTFKTSSPISQRPTTNQPTVNTRSPTGMPQKLTNFDFKEKYELPAEISRSWKQYITEMDQLLKGKKWAKGVFEQADWYEWCRKYTSRDNHFRDNPYPFPPESYFYENKPFSLSTLRKHVNAWIFAVASHYHYQNISDLDFVTSQAYNSTLRVALHYYKKIKAYQKDPKANPFKVVYGFAGTSVMSGQDNCYYYSLAPTLGRNFHRLFAPLMPITDFRNQGQEGAGAAEMTDQMLCSEQVMDLDLDFFHLWYPMMPQAQHLVKEAFVWRWFVHSKSLAQFTMVNDNLFPYTEYFQRGFMVNLLWSTGHNHLDYNSRLGFSWGVEGDMYCRFETRDGAPLGINNQNWHLGPMGFQYQADGIGLFHAFAMLKAIDWAMEATPILPVLDGIPSFMDPRNSNSVCEKWKSTYSAKFFCEITDRPRPLVCVSGTNPQFTKLIDFKRDWNALSIKDADYPNATAWEWYNSHPKSTIHSAKEQTVGHYLERPECSAHSDLGFTFRTRGSYATEWLQVTWPESATRRMGDWPLMYIMVTPGLRYPQRDYTYDAIDPGWLIETKIDGKLLPPYIFSANLTYPVYLGVIDYDRVTFTGPPIPIPDPGTKIEIRFRSNTVKNVTRSWIVVGNLLFFGTREREFDTEYAFQEHT